MNFKPKIKENRWDVKLEKDIFKKWLKDKIYKFDLNSKRKIFTIDTPPPYPSGMPWHIGAATHYSQIDMIARTAKMMGFEVHFPIGIDRNGVPVERYTEKKYGIKLQETPREKFIELCKTSLDDVEAYFIKIMKTMGMSGDFENYYRTDKEEYRKLTQSTFIELWKKGLIYEALRPTNYCVDCGTSIADADIEYKELPTQLVHVKFKLKETGEDMIIATTRPELICSCQMVIVNPDDERHKNLIGKHAVTPIYNREVSIKAHPAADPKFGTGIVMVCSYGDSEDVRLFRELRLKEIIAIDPNGKMTKKAGKYKGLTVKESKMKIIEDLESQGLVVKKEEIVHRTPMCDRSKTPIEIILMKEFYLKQLEFIPKIREVSKKLKFHPEVHRQIFNNWIDSVAIDWPISRRRFYGTEIPIWYCKKCGETILPEPEKYYKPWKQDPPVKKCKCGSKEFVGDERTFDTWFDSSVSPLFITKYLTDEKFFKKTYPTAIRPQAKDIIRTWLYYTILRCYQLTKQLPFNHVWIMGYGMDEKGERMSKSKGNVVDPLPILEKYGADNFRFWGAQEASLGSDFKCSEERIGGASKFLTKFWNMARFISSFPQVEAKPTATDKWILAELNKLVEDCRKGYEDFNFFIPASKIRDFVWSVFAPHYLEMVKPRAYGNGFKKSEQKAAWFTLYTVLKTLLILMSPITPFITEKIWTDIYSKKSVHLEKFPKVKTKSDLVKVTSRLIDFNSVVWNEKKEKGISLKDGIEIKIPKDLKKFEKDLRAMHNIKK